MESITSAVKVLYNKCRPTAVAETQSVAAENAVVQIYIWTPDEIGISPVYITGASNIISTRGLIIVLGSSQPSGKAGQTNGRTKSSSYSVAYSHPLSSKSAAFQPSGIGVTREKQPVFSPQEKKRAYDQRIREIEHGSFSPLVFSTTGGMGTTATVVYKRLAAMMAEKYEKPYGQIIQLIRCKLNFSLLRSAIMCIRGSRSARRHPDSNRGTGGSIDLACSVGRVPCYN